MCRRERKKKERKKNQGPPSFLCVAIIRGYTVFGLVVVCGGCWKDFLNKYVISRMFHSRAVLKVILMIRALATRRGERGSPSLSSLSLPDWSLPSGEAVTVLTDLEVEIQQCRLRHVMEAPTLGPLYAHCNRQEKTNVSLHPAFPLNNN